MKDLVWIFFLLAILSCSNQKIDLNQKDVLAELQKYEEMKDFFTLRSFYEKNQDAIPELESLYFKAIIDNVFNRGEESNTTINALIANKNQAIGDDMMNSIYKTKLLNHINLYEYAQAGKCARFILDNYVEFNDSIYIESLNNEIKIWEALRDVEKQEIEIKRDESFPMYRDKVGFFNIDIDINGLEKNFIFDTGANFSFIIKSLASELNLKIIPADFYVTAATGTRVDSEIAIAETISLGGIIAKNVVFLVLDDKDMSFPQIEYYPNGAIGFPVIEALEEVRISRDNLITVPQEPTQFAYNNFALDGLMPIVAAEYNGDVLRFNFDTGAAATSLYPLFFNKYQSEIESKYTMEQFSSGSGGGTVDFNGYVINDLNLKIGNSTAKIDSINLHVDQIGSEASLFHGNFGQDYIKQFSEMIISFKYSSVSFIK